GRTRSSRLLGWNAERLPGRETRIRGTLPDLLPDAGADARCTLAHRPPGADAQPLALRAQQRTAGADL
ncbi:MAG: hypothetical protein AVDCRST_MAG27-4594, partial [uncultured Craurococcus sp.]